MVRFHIMNTTISYYLKQVEKDFILLTPLVPESDIKTGYFPGCNKNQEEVSLGGTYMLEIKRDKNHVVGLAEVDYVSKDKPLIQFTKKIQNSRSKSDSKSNKNIVNGGRHNPTL